MEIEEGATDSLPIEMLPIDLVELVAQFLTVEDLIACCAVSVRMRDLFGDDIVWKSRCDKEHAEYLRITPCKVKPGFVSPEVEGSTLSPVSQWRMAFMREKHLWNNWRQSNHTTEVLRYHDSDNSGLNPICHIFCTNDHIIAVFKNRFELLDVKKYPAAHVDDPIQEIPNIRHIFSVEDDIWLAEGNFVIIRFMSLVYVYLLDVINQHWCLKHVFYFEEMQKLSLNYPTKLKKRFYAEESYLHFGVVCGVVEKTFVGAITGKSTFHIWNIETGMKLKEEECLVRNNSCKIMGLQVSQNMNLVLAVKVENETNSTTFLAYSLTTLSYFPFQIKIKGHCKFIVSNDSLCIWTVDIVHFYKYQTPGLIFVHRAHTASCSIKVIKRNFVFSENGTLKRFDPATQLIATLPIEGVMWFSGLHDRFIEIHGLHIGIELWEIQGMLQKVIKSSISLETFLHGSFLNKVFTRYINISNDQSVIHFW